MAGFNQKGKKILEAKRKRFKDGSDFSIAFLGDSHIGQDIILSPEKIYMNLLKRISGLKGIYAIIHGGDAVQYADAMLKKFADATERILKYKNSSISDENKKPLFANIGNHDYRLGSAPSAGVSIKDYTDIIGSDNDIIRFFGDTKGPRVAVVLLNTGYSDEGQLPGGKKFKDELESLSSKMTAIIKQHRYVRFIIDMHIPPRIPNQLTGSQVLNSTYNYYFRKFLKKHASKILAIVAHHKHDCFQDAAYHYNFSKKNKKYMIPVYVTAQGGHSDYSRSPDKNRRYSFYRMDLIKGGSPYMIKDVYRYDMVRNSKGIYVLNKPVLINK